MDTSTSTLLTATVVTGGIWAEGKATLTPRVLFAGVILAIMLTIMSQANAKLSQQFGALILVAAVFRYVPSIVGNFNAESKKK